MVENQIFCAAIHSQDSEQTSTDWRRSPNELNYSVFNLPDDVKSMCLKVVHNLGLTFGAIDMVLTPDDEYVFLEINPNGQWGWIERETGLPIREAIADTLVRDDSAS